MDLTAGLYILGMVGGWVARGSGAYQSPDDIYRGQGREAGLHTVPTCPPVLPCLFGTRCSQAGGSSTGTDTWRLGWQGSEEGRAQGKDGESCDVKGVRTRFNLYMYVLNKYFILLKTKSGFNRVYCKFLHKSLNSNRD